MKLFLKQFFGGTMLLGSLFSFYEINIISAICFAISGLICFPITLNWLEQKYHKKLSSKLKYALVIGFYVIGGAVNKNNKQNAPTPVPVAAIEPQVSPKPEAVYAAPIIVDTPKVEKPKKIEKVKEVTPPKAKVEHRPRHTYNSREYITGRRGGCFYINAYGNKVYVDHSYCY